jgi:chemotaxis signal transduction protein
MKPTGEIKVNFSEEERLRYWREMEKRAEARKEPRGRLHVIFSAGGARMAIDATSCSGVVPYSPATPLPFISRHILGVTFVKGKITSVTDTCSLMGSRPLENWRYLVLVKVEEVETALTAETVEKVLPVEDDKLVEAASEWPGARLGLVKGRARDVLPTLYVLDPVRCIMQAF